MLSASSFASSVLTCKGYRHESCDLSQNIQWIGELIIPNIYELLNCNILSTWFTARAVAVSNFEISGYDANFYFWGRIGLLNYVKNSFLQKLGKIWSQYRLTTQCNDLWWDNHWRFFWTHLPKVWQIFVHNTLWWNYE